ncbi:cytochrome c oxidase subunit 3 [Rheinheimera muenzenbergensis]|uniref:Cytochrome c oxidase subunit 3 n=1 Tax=Rheinheimera muenzenbergensis TaxID=1193628 RepID=A0ABU8C3S5_9GAMM
MSIFSKLTEKPWLAQPEGQDPALHYLPEDIWPQRTALKFFLATVSVLFSLFIVTLLGRSQLPDFQVLAGEPWLPLSDRSGLWLSTSLLLGSSLAMQLAQWCAARQRLSAVLGALTAAVALILLFLFAQYRVWLQLADAGFGFTDTAASNYFYLLTALHAVHLLGGVIAVSPVFLQLAKARAATLEKTLTLCCAYWHYLLLLWLLLFWLLTSPAQTLNTLAALCGFGEANL